MRSKYIPLLCSSLQLFLDSKDKNQKRIDDVVRQGDDLVNNNRVPKDKRELVKTDVKDIKESWSSILLRGEKLHTVITRYEVCFACSAYLDENLYFSEMLRFRHRRPSMVLAPTPWFPVLVTDYHPEESFENI